MYVGAPVYLTREGEESFSHSDRPSLDVVTIKRLITKLDINADGVLDAAGARRLDKGGYRLSEIDPAYARPQRGRRFGASRGLCVENR